MPQPVDAIDREAQAKRHTRGQCLNPVIFIPDPSFDRGWLSKNWRQQTVIAAHRYLAFIDLERRFLVHELYPDRDRGDGYFVPCDTAVNVLADDASPIERAAKVLGFLGIDPYQYDVSVDFIGVDLSQIPIIGTAGDEKNPGKIDWSKLRKRWR